MRLSIILFEKLTILIVIGIIMQNHDFILITMQIINIFDIGTSMRISDSTTLIGSTICLLVEILFVELFNFPNLVLANTFTSTTRTSMFLFISKTGEQTQINNKSVHEKNNK